VVKKMALTTEFKEVFKSSIDQDPEFGFEVLRGAVQALLDNDLPTGRSVLRNYVNATVGFRKLSEVTGLQEKSLMRMLSANGNPVASNLFAVIWALQDFNGVRLEVGFEAVGHDVVSATHAGRPRQNS
jgi:DNA-binding phage protein